MNMIHSTIMSLCICCVVAMPARATPDYAKINTAIATEIIVPAYDQLADASKRHAQDWRKACAGKGVSLDQLKTSYHDVASAWAKVFHWNFGPITFLLRRDKMYHWPERRNAVSKSLRKLLAKETPEKLEPDNFAHISVAAQGLPAMERLVFEYTDTLVKPWNCKVAETIAANMAVMAFGNAQEWREDVLPTIKRGDEHPIYFDGPKETLNKLFTELLTGYTIIKDQKVLPVLGSNAKKAKPNLVEARRSQRFLKNLKLNLQTLFAGDEVLSRFVPKAEAEVLAAKRKAVMDMALALPKFEEAAYDEHGRTQYKAFVKALSDLKGDMVQVYSKHIGVVIGFNSLDGD